MFYSASSRQVFVFFPPLDVWCVSVKQCFDTEGLKWCNVYVQFVEKRKELKQDGRTDKELAESYCFLLSDKVSRAASFTDVLSPHGDIYKHCSPVASHNSFLPLFIFKRGQKVSLKSDNLVIYFGHLSFFLSGFT